MPEYEVIHRLGCYICGLGSRPLGGVFVVSDEKAARLHLDESPMLKRVDARPKSKKVSEPAAGTPDDQQEG